MGVLLFKNTAKIPWLVWTPKFENAGSDHKHNNDQSDFNEVYTRLKLKPLPLLYTELVQSQTVFFSLCVCLSVCLSVMEVTFFNENLVC
jgi:hypothetical protein